MIISFDASPSVNEPLPGFVVFDVFFSGQSAVVSGGGGGGGGGGRSWPVRLPTRWGPWRPGWLDKALGEVRVAFRSTEPRDGIRLRGDLTKPTALEAAIVSMSLKVVEGSDTANLKGQVTLNTVKYDNDFLMIFSGEDDDG